VYNREDGEVSRANQLKYILRFDKLTTMSPGDALRLGGRRGKPVSSVCESIFRDNAMAIGKGFGGRSIFQERHHACQKWEQ
jgi:hypothetical protein